MTVWIAVALAAGLAAGESDWTRHDIDVTARYAAASGPGRDAAVLVELRPTSDDLHVNADPGPRLALDPSQHVLALRPSTEPAKPRPADPDAPPRYLDPDRPVSFPVVTQKGAARGAHLVGGTVTYFYCSKTAGWCRKGTAEIELGVVVK